jgi:hypothetical protein
MGWAWYELGVITPATGHHLAHGMLGLSEHSWRLGQRALEVAGCEGAGSDYTYGEAL